MIVWTFGELAHLTRLELYELERAIRETLCRLEPMQRHNALMSLDNIRRTLMHRDLHP